jgi:hypothetical protein
MAAIGVECVRASRSFAACLLPRRVEGGGVPGRRERDHAVDLGAG